ncbi:MFS transporter [Enterobacteriaceae bacterium BIT-l23]|uniref:MFS transporter n=1 Tax=Jejubacter sp. L23 TaxID=3092086 RepID=UPI001584FDB0|nr:MFS transporter [Enterobacteriaceae bacterium BIT-l23]
MTVRAEHRADHSLVSGKTLFAVVLGNGLEIFDFTVYSFFAIWIGQAFFPGDDALTELLYAVGVFGVGFLARPIGALVLGRYADRAGRRAAMSLSILLMAVSTAAIALCPTWESIGWFAPLLIVCARLIQGFAAGGEVGATTAWLLESAPSTRLGRRVRWQMVSQGGASMSGALCGFGVSHAFDSATLTEWGWRVPFVIGALIAPLGYYLRRSLPETLPRQLRPKPLAKQLLRRYALPVVVGSCLTVGQSVTMYIMVFYMPGYLIHLLSYPAELSFIIAVLASFAFAVCAFLGGWIVDRYAKLRTISLAAFTLTALCCLPAFGIIIHASNSIMIVVVPMIMAGVLGMGVVATLILILMLFPTQMRATGFAISYALANTLFGGTAQFIATALIAETGNVFAPAWYLLACNLIAIAALLILHKCRPSHQDEAELNKMTCPAFYRRPNAGE